MLTIHSRVRIFAAVEPIDFRKGFDGLVQIVRDGFREDPFGGDLFCFFNRRRDRVKVLVWDRNGFWLHYKRLERGTFEGLARTRRARVRRDPGRAGGFVCRGTGRTWALAAPMPHARVHERSWTL